MEPASDRDKLLQATCQAIVSVVAAGIDSELASHTLSLRVPGGPEVGKQITIDATEKDGLKNVCRLSAMDPALAPEGEAVRIEYERDEQGKYGPRRVYSVQSVRKRGGELTLLENFLAESPASVREADFRPVKSEAYAQTSVLKTVQDWTRYRAWQLQEAKKK